MAITLQPPADPAVASVPRGAGATTSPAGERGDASRSRGTSGDDTRGECGWGAGERERGPARPGVLMLMLMLVLCRGGRGEVLGLASAFGEGVGCILPLPLPLPLRRESATGVVKGVRAIACF